MHPTRLAHAAVPLIVLLVAGCTVGPDFESPDAWWKPAAWSGTQPAAPKAEAAAESQPVAEPVDPMWWRAFGDAKLTVLEQRLSGANLYLRAASLRLAEAREAVGIAKSAAYPSINANGSYTREQVSHEGALALASQDAASAANGAAPSVASATNSSMFQPFDLYQYGFDVSWEADLWGRVRRSVESASANLQASAEAQRDTLVTASAELARDYIQLRGAQRTLEITRQNLDIARQSLDLTRQRAAGGVTTELDVANAAAQVASTAAQLPGLEAQQAELINAIGLLLGEAPQAMRAELETAQPVPPVPPRVAVGVPSELARRRPDIRRAEAQLHAATADVGVATADFYPRFVLSGSGAIQGVQFANLADWGHANTYAFGPSITLPIFEGGRLTRTLELRQTQQQEAVLIWQRTVLGALHEVDNALTAYQAEQQRR
ncbi:MAG: efflux transporter outer membrane subunit, partial [Nevskia sp.]|nr:efflux transporter outer membrane subunit [Nevskia sp.]